MGFQEKTTAESNAIYISVLTIITLALLSLSWITVSISVKSPALLRPAIEIITIRSLVNGRIKESFLRENQTVQKGDVLYVLESDVHLEKEKHLTLKIRDTEDFVSDLENLMNIRSQIPDLITPLFRQSYFNYEQKLREATIRYKKVRRDYERNQKLHREKVIADAEFENFQFELDKAGNDLELVRQDQLRQWQNALKDYEREQVDFNSQLVQLQEEKENLAITAPVSGSIQNVKVLYPGSIVFANQDLVQISPDTNLIVEAYISPNDIGLLKETMPVRFQVDAFNYNQWGLATGKVTEISNDIYIVNEKPVFKVTCRLSDDYLQLKNGHKGYLKKGMTLQARFIVTERTLWQLLYDKVDDWINPNTFVK
jgi:membrane fusion protein, peptide pheromone/bacteriocin exporter